ncbi:lysophospholipid transporter LplT [Aquabacterium sp. OR-4]|uniref:lysophospholipid transporter LplT n=1 Tax=Aquabacterium sp. OR-4 TaxID=2978127 RepID=UPI0028C928EA|nr:lysophospholipid transporter LplT [Aquabacterium sp. OR-4]MDT7838976.1 lysophospholipid transporter LplT [Aquabacterium sp. OR-4]
MPRGFHRLMAAQFCSSLADNALLIVAIALLAQRGLPPWWAPLLKLGSTVSYVVLAPFVGVLADAWPKARLMEVMNALKLLAALALLAGLHPVAAFGLVGLGAAAYAPAKYGLVTELVGPERLVRANGWIEVSVVGAALLGAVLGGLLVSPRLLGHAALAPWHDALPQACGPLAVSLAVVVAIYALAGLTNRRVPDSGHPLQRVPLHPRALLRDFGCANRTLWRDHEGGLSLTVTTLFWGLGATLQFAVLRWAEQVLALPLAQSAGLQAVIGVGVVLGAAVAGRYVPLAAARRMLWAGVLLGLMMPLVAATQQLALAAALLLVVGAVGGLMVVPLNALLQHRGHVLLSPGRSIAVQGFNENASVLAMLALYALLLKAELPIVQVMALYGLLIAASIGALAWREHRRGPRI